MNKLATLGGVVVVVVAATAVGGAWYTGTRIEPLLRDQVEQVNAQALTAFAGRDAALVVKLDTFERHLFSSDVRYQVVFTSHELNGGEPIAFGIAEHIEHGPFPGSRVMGAKLLPVMASSSYALQNSRDLQGWFERSQGASPVTGQVTIGYDQSIDASMKMLPLQWEDAHGKGQFSGLEVRGKGSLDGQRMQAEGSLGRLQATLHNEAGDVNIALEGLTFNSGGLKGVSGFYLGNSEVKVASATFQALNKPAVQLNGVLGLGSLEELDGMLKGHNDYSIDALSIDGKPVGSLNLRAVIDRFDVAATRDLMALYKNTLEPQVQAAAAAGVPFHPQLSPAEQLQVQASALRLLAGNPHFALENVGLKTARGESHASFAVDLTKPADLNLPQDQLLKQAVKTLDLKLAVAKLTVQDLATVQGQLQGQTDAVALARNAEGASTLFSTLVTLKGLGRVEGNDVVSELHYEDGQVTFNGQTMSVEQFVAMMAGQLMRG